MAGFTDNPGGGVSGGSLGAALAERAQGRQDDPSEAQPAPAAEIAAEEIMMGVKNSDSKLIVNAFRALHEAIHAPDQRAPFDSGEIGG